MPFGIFSSKRLAIDLGTANCFVWSAGEGVVLEEPSVVAVDAVTGKVAAVGSVAHEMLGKTAEGSLLAQKPLKDGVIADYLIAEAMLGYFLDRVLRTSRLSRPEVMVSVPAGITQVERRAVLEATLTAGAKVAYLIEHPLSAALGAKLPIEQAQGSMIIDIGGGQVGCAIVSLGGLVVVTTARAGGERLDEAIAIYMRRIHNLIIGERMAEEIKIKAGSALPATTDKTVEVRGRDAITGLPKIVTVQGNEVTEAMGPVLTSIVNCAKSALEQTPPELASDIIDRGIVLVGGTAQLRNLDRLIANQTGVGAHVVEDPRHCVVYGAGVALENLERWRKVVQAR